MNNRNDFSGRFVVLHTNHKTYVSEVEPRVAYSSNPADAHIFDDVNEALKYRTNPSEAVIDIDDKEVESVYVWDSLLTANSTLKQAHERAEHLSRRLDLPFGVCKVPNEHRYWVTKYPNKYMMYYFEQGEMVNY